MDDLSTVDQDQLNRRLKFADMLRQQAFQPDQQQMAGGYVIPYSPLQGLAKLAQGYVAGKITNDVEEQQKQIATEKNKKIADALKNYGKVTEDTPNITTDFYTNKPLYEYTKTTRDANPTELMQQDWQLSQLDPSFSKILEARKTREDAQQARLEQIRLQQQLMAENRKANAQPYFTPLQTAQGIYSFDARKGTVSPIQGGETGTTPLVGAQYDPRLQGQLSGAKAGAADIAKQTAEAQVKLPQVVSTANDLSRHIDELIGSKDGQIPEHPGMGSYLATSGAMGYVPKTEAADFKSRLDQLQGGTFLQAYNTLRGGGQITEIEGAKATAALNRARGAQNESAFKSALRDFQDIINQGVERASRAAQGNYAVPTQPAQAGGAKFLGFE